MIDKNNVEEVLRGACGIDNHSKSPFTILKMDCNDIEYGNAHISTVVSHGYYIFSITIDLKEANGGYIVDATDCKLKISNVNYHEYCFMTNDKDMIINRYEYKNHICIDDKSKRFSELIDMEIDYASLCEKYDRYRRSR